MTKEIESWYLISVASMMLVMEIVMNEFTQLILSAIAAIVLFTALHFGALVTGEDAYFLRVVVLLIPCGVAAFFYNAPGCSFAFGTVQITLSLFDFTKMFTENTSIGFSFIFMAVIAFIVLGGLTILYIKIMVEAARKKGLKLAWLFAILGIEVCAAMSMLLTRNIHTVVGIAMLACCAVFVGYLFGRNQRALIAPAT